MATRNSIPSHYCYTNLCSGVQFDLNEDMRLPNLAWRIHIGIECLCRISSPTLPAHASLLFQQLLKKKKNQI